MSRRRKRKYRGTTAQRGYGRQHQLKRERLLRAFRPGQPCARCGRPMLDKEAVQLGHPDFGSPGGLEHAYCNLRAGGISSAVSQGRRPRMVTCRCGRPFIPVTKAQTVCSPACGNVPVPVPIRSGRQW